MSRASWAFQERLLEASNGKDQLASGAEAPQSCMVDGGVEDFTWVATRRSLTATWVSANPDLRVDRFKPGTDKRSRALVEERRKMFIEPQEAVLSS